MIQSMAEVGFVLRRGLRCGKYCFNVNDNSSFKEFSWQMSQGIIFVKLSGMAFFGKDLSAG